MSNHDELDDKLAALEALHTPAPNEARRNQALDAAMLAFDAEPSQVRLRQCERDFCDG